MKELIIRFILGGIIVSSFAMLGDVFRPKSFAGIFGAAPSIALATIWLTITHDGKLYLAQEGLSMIFGASAFFVYAKLVSWILRRYKPASLLVAITLLPIWLGVSLGLWFIVERCLFTQKIKTARICGSVFIWRSVHSFGGFNGENLWATHRRSFSCLPCDLSGGREFDRESRKEAES